MERVFIEILNRSIAVSWMILAIIGLRLLLRKTPRKYFVLMWALVALRLIMPFSIESVTSLIPSAQTVPQEIVYAEIPEIDSGISAVDELINPAMKDSMAPAPAESVNPLQVVTFAASVVWLAGIGVMLIYAFISWLRIRLRVKVSAAAEPGVRVCDDIDTPFILGIFAPVIYLPSGLKDPDREYVIEHESTHLKRGDHLWKPIGYLILTLSWFNPLMWAAYILLCRDIEYACDERVLAELGSAEKRSYATALLNCSVPRRMIAAAPLAFGETNVKSRILNILKYRKATILVSCLAAVLCLAVTACFMTDPKKDIADNEPAESTAGSETAETEAVYKGKFEELIDRLFAEPDSLFVAQMGYGKDGDTFKPSWTDVSEEFHKTADELYGNEDYKGIRQLLTGNRYYIVDRSTSAMVYDPEMDPTDNPNMVMVTVVDNIMAGKVTLYDSSGNDVSEVFREAVKEWYTAGDYYSIREYMIEKGYDRAEGDLNFPASGMTMASGEAEADVDDGEAARRAAVDYVMDIIMSLDRNSTRTFRADEFESYKGYAAATCYQNQRQMFARAYAPGAVIESLKAHASAPEQQPDGTYISNVQTHLQYKLADRYSIAEATAFTVTLRGGSGDYYCVDIDTDGSAVNASQKLIELMKFMVTEKGYEEQPYDIQTAFIDRRWEAEMLPRGRGKLDRAELDTGSFVSESFSEAEIGAAADAVQVYFKDLMDGKSLLLVKYPGDGSQAGGDAGDLMTMTIDYADEDGEVHRDLSWTLRRNAAGGWDVVDGAQ